MDTELIGEAAVLQDESAGWNKIRRTADGMDYSEPKR